MRSIQVHRGGFTLIELLVLITIISIIIGLSLAGVQRARSAAARTRCQNNLKQLALALHNYESARGMLPAGNSYLDGKSPQLNMGWETRLLPYLEQESLWREALDAFQKEPFFEKPPHLKILERVIPAFICPADSRSQEAHAFNDEFKVAFTDYLGIGGTDYAQLDGILFVDSAVRFIEISDGTSNTVMIGERPPSADFNFGWWYAGWGQARNGSAEMLMGVRELNNPVRYQACPKGPYHFVAGQPSEQCDAFHFWSLHSSGANFAFADGSVRFLSYSADSVLPALATRAGGEVVDIP